MKHGDEKDAKYEKEIRNIWSMLKTYDKKL